MTSALDVGFYGKLPSHGDFLRRRVSEAFVEVWDGWLQACLAASRAALGDRWLQVYLTSPAWRFACAAGACGPVPLVGVMAPSVDRVGRYFPLTIVTEIPRLPDPIAAIGAAEGFFERAEQLILETLAEEPVDFARFDEGAMQIGRAPELLHASSTLVLDGRAATMLCDGATAPWQVPVGSPPRIQAALQQIVAQRLGVLFEPLMVWSTEGSAIVEPCCLFTQGLPDPETFVALLDGSWRERQWQTVPASIDASRRADDETAVGGRPPLRCHSAALTDVGSVRRVNQDAFLERPEAGIWAVADGLGGLSDGDVASRMVCDALADIVPQPTLEGTIDAARARLDDVNAYLVRAAERPMDPVRSGSTVVALCVRDDRCAILWAGDSRCYRYRRGALERLTRDHGVEGEGEEGEAPHAITRAVGGEADLALDLHWDGIQLGDRFLLCSDGLTRTVPEPTMEAWLSHEDIRRAVEGLIAAALEAGGPDNVTVLVVEAAAG